MQAVSNRPVCPVLWIFFCTCTSKWQLPYYAFKRQFGTIWVAGCNSNRLLSNKQTAITFFEAWMSLETNKMRSSMCEHTVHHLSHNAICELFSDKKRLLHVTKTNIFQIIPNFFGVWEPFLDFAISFWALLIVTNRATALYYGCKCCDNIVESSSFKSVGSIRARYLPA